MMKIYRATLGLALSCALVACTIERMLAQTPDRGKCYVRGTSAVSLQPEVVLTYHVRGKQRASYELYRVPDSVFYADAWRPAPSATPTLRADTTLSSASLDREEGHYITVSLPRFGAYYYYLRLDPAEGAGAAVAGVSENEGYYQTTATRAVLIDADMGQERPRLQLIDTRVGRPRTGEQILVDTGDQKEEARTDAQGSIAPSLYDRAGKLGSHDDPLRLPLSTERYMMRRLGNLRHYTERPLCAWTLSPTYFVGEAIEVCGYVSSRYSAGKSVTVWGAMGEHEPYRQTATIDKTGFFRLKFTPPSDLGIGIHKFLVGVQEDGRRTEGAMLEVHLIDAEQTARVATRTEAELRAVLSPAMLIEAEGLNEVALVGTPLFVRFALPHQMALPIEYELREHTFGGGGKVIHTGVAVANTLSDLSTLTSAPAGEYVLHYKTYYRGKMREEKKRLTLVEREERPYGIGALVPEGNVFRGQALPRLELYNGGLIGEYYQCLTSQRGKVTDWTQGYSRARSRTPLAIVPDPKASRVDVTALLCTDAQNRRGNTRDPRTQRATLFGLDVCAPNIDWAATPTSLAEGQPLTLDLRLVSPEGKPEEGRITVLLYDLDLWLNGAVAHITPPAYELDARPYDVEVISLEGELPTAPTEQEEGDIFVVDRLKGNPSQQIRHRLPREALERIVARYAPKGAGREPLAQVLISNRPIGRAGSLSVKARLPRGARAYRLVVIAHTARGATVTAARELFVRGAAEVLDEAR